MKKTIFLVLIIVVMGVVGCSKTGIEESPLTIADEETLDDVTSIEGATKEVETADSEEETSAEETAKEEELTDSNAETVVDETDTVSLIVEVEGMEETVPGYLHSTDGYKITYDMERFEYTKKDGSDTFIAENPDPEIYPYVYLSVNHIENKSVSDYAKELSKTLSENNLISETATDAAIGNYTGTIVRAQAGSEWNSIIRNYYIIENGKSIYVLESQYFVEAAEGYGARIYAMLNTFEIL